MGKLQLLFGAINELYNISFRQKWFSPESAGDFSKSLLLEPCVNQAQGLNVSFFRLLPILIVTKLVKKTECDWYVNPKYVLVLKKKG